MTVTTAVTAAAAAARAHNNNNIYYKPRTRFAIIARGENYGSFIQNENIILYTVRTIVILLQR